MNVSRANRGPLHKPGDVGNLAWGVTNWKQIEGPPWTLDANGSINTAPPDDAKIPPNNRGLWTRRCPPWERTVTPRVCGRAPLLNPSHAGSSMLVSASLILHRKLHECLPDLFSVEVPRVRCLNK